MRKSYTLSQDEICDAVRDYILAREPDAQPPGMEFVVTLRASTGQFGEYHVITAEAEPRHIPQGKD